MTGTLQYTSYIIDFFFPDLIWMTRFKLLSNFCSLN